MRNLSETGADAITPDRLTALAQANGRVLIIRSVKITAFERFGGKRKAILETTDEQTGEARDYISGSTRLLMQAEALLETWKPDECVRAVVRGRKNAHGTLSVWLEEAPPRATTAPAVTDTPTEAPTEAPTDSDALEAEAKRKAAALNLTAAGRLTIRKKYTASDGRIDWQGINAHLDRMAAPAKSSTARA